MRTAPLLLAAALAVAGLSGCAEPGRADGADGADRRADHLGAPFASSLFD